jgi:hypothetical protein
VKRTVPFAVVFATSLALVSVLPLYVERTMTHIMFADGSGGAIEWGWKVCTLRTFFSDYRYFRHIPRPELWITMNILLALSYASIIAFVVSRLFNRGSKRS